MPDITVACRYALTRWDGRAPGFGTIYGSTVETLVNKEAGIPEYQNRLLTAKEEVEFVNSQPYTLDPYPYDDSAWQPQHASRVPCDGPTEGDIRVFIGHPRDYPGTGFGSYDVLGLTKSLCFERETRMGPYGFSAVAGKNGKKVDWDKVNWGELQHQCREQNRARFHRDNKPNRFLGLVEDESEEPGSLRARSAHREELPQMATTMDESTNETVKMKESRTALLLRTYTGKQYNENDKQMIRSLVTELSLRTGGEYEVSLFLHVKDDTDIWASEEAYRQVVEKYIPPEFWNMTVLWNTEKVKRTYPKLTPKALLVHNGQFSPIQIFMQEHREFDYVWNWEMDSRLIGHHYDFLTKLANFSRKQPRKGLWERNERYYIPSFHGDYETDFRTTIEHIYAGNSVWGAPDIPAVKPVGPKPPVPRPEDDDYKWGVGEEADLITLAPIFNPINSNWVLRNQVWGYRSRDFAWGDLPRRATIITQLRASRRLLDIMHVENLRGNHLASEMVAQTVALIHGLKAVYAPMPVYFDRAWDGAQLAKWFNGGPKGESGSFGSAMGWGQEGRFQGSTWYFRAIPPQKLYNNWMGYEDAGIGGVEWEKEHGRACLPMMMLHPVKEVKETEQG